ncbi:type IV pilus biogenesis/stability protein PilW [Vibrio sp. 10N.286.49.C2]|uniref:type IV pilus biogenesis/stability protein PilW n=1 Tax=unclassified Vibrio TaxID=2614977 RepID=UPI000C818123|nr:MULTISPECIES: type IV pilus biogenesis/stability protein PilW [unclassified Vibrio]PMH31626.1 type IV pilus biogenesis/stability protein PilW [Vibrio sp. 10N.286.49.C2]PMH50648.1 type IV pilus biogenesis/stability protein PilW [Vibrio sp. 10N.286.49.B1]PMH79315.1 type IV pilus biogenesis/stability protein PilW [Vibrio sp. 10N.286.48.B7]
MIKWLVSLICILILSGCVTIDEGADRQQRDPVAIAESRIALGLGYMNQGDYARAKQNFEKAMEHAPNYYRSTLTMAHYFETVGDDDNAKAMYQRSIRMHPHNGNVLNNYGAFLCKQGDFIDADRYFNRAIEQPYYYLVSASYENAGWCALKSNDINKAKTYFSKALDHQPLRPNSIIQLAKIEVSQNQLKEARLRLLAFNQRYGYQDPSLKVLIMLESKAGNPAMVSKYQALLSN